MVTGEDAAQASRYTIQSVARAVAILDFLAGTSDGGETVTEIAKASGLSKSAAFAVLQTLLDAGYVSDRDTGRSRRYRLGRELIRLGDRAREQTPVGDVARPALQRLAQSLGLSVRLGVLQGDRVVIVQRVDSPGALRIDLRMGDQELLHCTAIGKAILAGHSDAQVREILGATPLLRQTPNTITDRDAFIAHLQIVRAQGYAVDDEEDFEGVICIGAALRDHSSQVVGAISVTAVKAGLPPGGAAAIGATLSDGARELSAALGYRDNGA